MYVELKTLDIPVCKNPEDTATIDWQKPAAAVTLCGDYFSFFLLVVAPALYYLDTQRLRFPELEIDLYRENMKGCNQN